jgi:hypothetical protein
MKKFVFIVCAVFLTVHIAYAEEIIQDRLSFNSTKEKEICMSIKEAIKDGLNTKQVVMTAIKLGHSACLVVKCAIEGGGDLKEVVTGAIEAGAMSNVVARCSVDAGADPQEVGGYILIAGLPDSCYFEPQMLDEREIENPQGEETGGGFLSPSTP